ncbi:MAG: DUF1772 domain-containing protein, partial [Pseudonocardiaceae bacterium]
GLAELMLDVEASSEQGDDPAAPGVHRRLPTDNHRPNKGAPVSGSWENGMLELSRGAALVAATIAMGLFAGLFYTFACAVMPGLHRMDDHTFVSGMQQINVAILNGWFFATFLGAPLVTALAGLLQLGGGSRRVLLWIVAAFILCVVAFVITVVVNVPLNDALAAAGDPAQTADLAAVRAQFEASWVRWNLARAVASTAAFGCLTWALVLYGRATATT